MYLVIPHVLVAHIDNVPDGVIHKDGRKSTPVSFHYFALSHSILAMAEDHEYDTDLASGFGNQSVKITTYITINYYQWIICAGLSTLLSFSGIIGNIFLFVTLYKSDAFTNPVFICYNALGLSGLVHAVYSFYITGWNILVTQPYIRAYLISSYTLFWMRQIGISSLAIAGRNWGIYLVVFVRLQRAAASLAPRWFRYISNKKACITVSVLAGLIALAMQVRFVFLRRLVVTNGHYALGTPLKALQDYSRILLYNNLAVVPLILVSSALAIIGLMKVIWLR